MTITKLITAGSTLLAVTMIAVNPAIFHLAFVARNGGQIGRMGFRRLREYWSYLGEGVQSRERHRSRSAMHTVIAVLFVFVLLVVGSALTSSQPPTIMSIFASAFSASLTGWTLRQYDRKFIPLTVNRAAQLHFVDPYCMPPVVARRKVA